MGIENEVSNIDLAIQAILLVLVFGVVLFLSFRFTKRAGEILDDPVEEIKTPPEHLTEKEYTQVTEDLQHIRSTITDPEVLNSFDIAMTLFMMCGTMDPRRIPVMQVLNNMLIGQIHE